MTNAPNIRTTVGVKIDQEQIGTQTRGNVLAEVWAHGPTYLRNYENDPRGPGKSFLFVRRYRIVDFQSGPVLRCARDVIEFADTDEMFRWIEDKGSMEVAELDDNPPLTDVPEVLAAWLESRASA